MCYAFRVILSVVSLAVILSSPSAVAQERPFQLALVTPIQLFPDDNSITGVRINLLYGRNLYVTGLDLGLVNHTTSGVTTGVQWGLVGMVDQDFSGWQNNTVNVVQGNCEGFQWGAVNYAQHVGGLQLGLVNYAVTMKGLQIGLVNIIKQGGQFPVFPLVNWSF
jgi:hypothetical protein